MAQEGFKRKLTAIFSADVEGYSRLMGDNEEATVRTLTSYREVLTTLIHQHNGKVVDSPGDNLLAEFVSVVDAVQCAVAVQKEIKSRNDELPENRRMQFRIGINLGDVIQQEERIYGDGVNIAARLEGLADPGGICISKTAFDQIETKLPYGYDFLGDQTVKNIAKPVGAYRVIMEPRVTVAGKSVDKKSVALQRMPILVGAVAVLVLAVAAGIWQFYVRRPSVEPASVEKMAYPLPDKPSIAVLPFTNMSDDSKQEYFADGITEDLITDLSQMSGLFVIARNSTFVYKGKPVRIRQVAEELGVRYVLEGSVRKAGEQVRINTQLIDATTGNHLWAKRYDGKLDNIFALQDKITQKIVAALAVKLSVGEREKVSRKETDNIEAYDAFLKGWEHYRRWTPEDFRKAIPYFERAIELDSQYGRAYAAIASVYTEGYQRAWDWSHVLGVSAEAMPGLAGEYLKEALNYPTPLAHQVASKWYIILLFPEEAIAEAERAIALDSNDAVGYTAMAGALIYSGKPEEAVDFVNKAMRLDPHNITNYLYTLGLAHFGMEKFQEAVSFFERAFKLNPEIGLVQRAYIAAAYVHLGQEEKAMAELDKPEIKEVRALYDLYVKYEGAYYKNPKDKARLIDSLRKVGLDRGK
jgi:TolB-like protein/class 3 adenylate cyclase